MKTADDPAREPTSPLVADAAPRVSLVAQAGSQGQARIECRRVVTLLGARPGCKVVLKSSRVSPIHAAVVQDGAQVTAVDLLTPGGTQLNGLKMEHEKLSHGDVIAIDPWEFRVEIRPPPADGAEDAPPFDLDPTPRIVALEHVASRRILQPNRRICILGRRRGCDITIEDVRVSRAHALLFSYFGYPAIFDLLTRNGTQVNDQPIGFRVLKNDDVISIGDSRFIVHLAESAAGAAPAANPNQTPAEPIRLTPENAPDMIDIKATEGSQRWRIAESLEKAARKK